MYRVSRCCRRVNRFINDPHQDLIGRRFEALHIFLISYNMSSWFLSLCSLKFLFTKCRFNRYFATSTRSSDFYLVYDFDSSDCALNYIEFLVNRNYLDHQLTYDITINNDSYFSLLYWNGPFDIRCDFIGSLQRVYELHKKLHWD